MCHPYIEHSLIMEKVRRQVEHIGKEAFFVSPCLDYSLAG